jgi:hypothetical protein
MSKVSEAYKRANPIRDVLIEIGHCMEVTEDKCGILWERWTLHDGNHVVLFATPHWFDVFMPVTQDQSIAGLRTELLALAAARK